MSSLSQTTRRAAVAAAVAVAGALLLTGTPAFASTVRPVNVLIEAESYNAQHGTRIVSDSRASAGKAVACISNGDTLRYDGVDLGATPRDVSGFILFRWNVTARGTMVIRLDSLTAAPAATLNFDPTGTTPGWLQSTTRWVPVTPTGTAVGVHTLYFTFQSTSGRPFMALDAFTVLKQTPIPMP